jgi:hypothetical protein
VERREYLIAQQQLLYAHYEDAKAVLLALPGVVDVGIGMKERGGQWSNEVCYRVYVHDKVPESDLEPSARVPSNLFGLKTDVLQEIVGIDAADCGDETRCAGYEPSTMNSYEINRETYRALRPGIRINRGFVNASAGTLGAIVKVNSSGAYAILTCAHVLQERGGKITSRIGQPSMSICGCNGVATILDLENDILDCGIACIDRYIGVLNEFPKSGLGKRIYGSIAPLAEGSYSSVVCCDKVWKCGATSGWTSGRIIDVSKNGGNDMLIAPEVGVRSTKSGTDSCFALGGDSGSMILVEDATDNLKFYVVGMLHKVDETNIARGLAHHIHPVILRLGISFEVEDWVVGFQVKGDSVVGGLEGSPTDRAPLSIEVLQLLGIGTNKSWNLFWQEHEAEIFSLIQQCRPVKLAWVRGQGPGFAAAIMKAQREPGFVPPQMINGITYQGLLLKMIAVLSDHGSPALRSALDQLVSAFFSNHLLSHS